MPARPRPLSTEQHCLQQPTHLCLSWCPLPLGPAQSLRLAAAHTLDQLGACQTQDPRCCAALPAANTAPVLEFMPCPPRSSSNPEACSSSRAPSTSTTHCCTRTLFRRSFLQGRRAEAVQQQCGVYLSSWGHTAAVRQAVPGKVLARGSLQATGDCH